jgi:hypothetical protein
MTPEERQAACRLIAEKIEGAKAIPHTHNESLYCVKLVEDDREHQMGGYMVTVAGAWRALYPDIYTTLEELFRAVRALPMKVPIGISRGFYSNQWEIIILSNNKIRSNADTLEEALFTALYEYAKTL